MKRQSLVSSWKTLYAKNDPDFAYVYAPGGAPANQVGNLRISFEQMGFPGQVTLADVAASPAVLQIAGQAAFPDLGSCGQLSLAGQAMPAKPLTFGGADILTLSSGHPLVAAATTSVASGRVEGTFATPVPVRLPLALLGTAPATMQVVHIVLDPAKKTGVVHGFFDAMAVTTEIIPGIGASARAEVAAGTAQGSTGKAYLDLFDTDKDGTITDEEVAANALIQATLAYDLAVYTNGVYAPTKDGVPDALSNGVGIEIVDCSF